jgi:hypothetical protein
LLLPPLLVIAGCGGGASGEAPTPDAPPGGTPSEQRAATGPVIRWDEAEHGPLGVAQRWADEGGYVNELKDILSGRDPRGVKMRARLEDLDDPVRRPEVLTELLDYFDKSGHPTLISVLRDFPRDFAMVLVKLREAWAYGPLRTTVARLCKRTEFETTDIQGGPARVWALRVAGLATVKEAKEGILLAAGYAKGDNGLRLAADPYGPAEAMAKQIIREKMRKKR